jgi:tRNA threonylcarbamoyladenosine modification (KEOPS) complex Cgi121 subunit
MLIVRGESRLSAGELMEGAREERILLLKPGKVESVEELELAYALAKKSIEEGKAIGRGIGTEFVLWPAGKRDISRAFEEVGFGRGKEFIAVGFGIKKAEMLGKLEMKEKKLGLKKKAGWEKIERISLGRIL